jgi:hypothetical protein
MYSVVSTMFRSRNCSDVVQCMSRVWTCKLCRMILLRGCEDRGKGRGMLKSREEEQKCIGT